MTGDIGGTLGVINSFSCLLYQNLQVVGESDEVYLQFHARRINYQCFTLHIAENVDESLA
jgi:hypothetical protein